MSEQTNDRLYLPKGDRSYWRNCEPAGSPLLYLAWGYRDFHQQPIPVSCHDGVVCVMIEEGSPTLTAAGQAIRLSAGALALIAPECPFGWSQATKGDCKFLLWMWQSLADEHLNEAFKNGPVIRAMNRKERKPLASLHDLCRREVLNLGGPDPRFMAGCQLIFESTLKRAIQESRTLPQATSELSEQVKIWMNAHLDSKEPIARLCDYLNLSQSTLYRLFKAEVGLSPLAHFHQIRMQKARDLLTQSSLSIKEIAFQFGYEHFNDFSRAYRNYFGHSPRTERNQRALK
jgi:AraC-like DNA-binding protein